jgi:hypothetical protein
MNGLQDSQTMALKHQALTEVSDTLSKYGAWIAYVCIGLVGKFGWDIVAKKKPSGWYIVGTGCMGVFVGFITSRWCLSHSPETGSYIVPVATLCSRDILVFVRMIDWSKVANAILKADIFKTK